MPKPARLPLRTLLAGGLLLVAAVPLAAQDVDVMPMGSTLMLTGSDLAVEFTISNNPLGDDGNGPPTGDAVTVTPAKGTTLNGSPDAQSFEAIKKLTIKLGEESDLLHFVDFSFAGTIKLKAGAGDDAIDFSNCSVEGKEKLSGDDGDDSFTFTNCFDGKISILSNDGKLTVNITDSNFFLTSITGGTDDDTVTFDNVSVDTSSRFVLKQGNDSVQLTGVSVNTDTHVTLSTGDNQFTSTGSSFGEQFKLVGGNGADTFSFQDSQIGEALKVTMGPGVNSLALNSVASPMQVGEQLIVKGGPNPDTVTFADGADPGTVIQVGEFLRVSLSGDVNALTTTGLLQVGEDLKYTGGSGNDLVSLDGTSIGEDATFSLAAGNNDIALNDCGGDDLKITAGGGDDTVALTGTTPTTFTGKQTIKLGGGDNQGP
ncbi:MAG TPA: hypothetical protein VFY71_11675 [Planctomycetota bacterium]|nr:hypothetical protein [Planctomycetota bacterium]